MLTEDEEEEEAEPVKVKVEQRELEKEEEEEEEEGEGEGEEDESSTDLKRSKRPRGRTFAFQGLCGGSAIAAALAAPLRLGCSPHFRMQNLVKMMEEHGYLKHAHAKGCLEAWEVAQGRAGKRQKVAVMGGSAGAVEKGGPSGAHILKDTIKTAEKKRPPGGSGQQGRQKKQATRVQEPRAVNPRRGRPVKGAESWKHGDNLGPP